MPTVQQVLKAAIEQWEEIGATDSPKLDAEVLLAFVMQRSRAFVIANQEQALTEFELTHFKELVDDRARLYPVAYLTGEKEFWSMSLKVNEKVLVPRPETELLVERTLHLREEEANSLLDLGTGSGAIALALAKELADCKVLATDFSKSALELAESNRLRHELNNVSFKQADWFFGLGKKRFDLIVSNPPYIDPMDPHLESEVRYEPQSALVAMEAGLADIAFIIKEAPEYLTNRGWLLLEHGYDQGARVREFMRVEGYVDITTSKDLAGNDRVTEGRLPVVN